LIEGFSGTIPADKGFIDEYQQSLWQEKQQTQIVTPQRKNMESSPEQVKLVKKTRVLAQISGNSQFTTDGKISNNQD